MTDNEIIKANDILNKFDFFNQRAGRELWNEKTVAVQDEDIRDREKDIKFLKDLINRQKAQIERLEKENRILSHDADTAFQEGLNENRDLFKKEVEPEIRAETIKEFAARIKERAYEDELAEDGAKVIDVDDIDNLVEEMTEKKETR